jgi:phosphatidylserine/phosphatidylglycerophosphate/cardiolipin synthase-like enzyme
MRALSATAARHARRAAARTWPACVSAADATRTLPRPLLSSSAARTTWLTCGARASHADAAADDAAAALQRALCGVARPLGVRGDDVRVLASPSDYEAALLHGFATAKKRVVMASLYWGAEAPRERALLAALAAAARSRPELEVTVLLDALRGTRPVPDGRGGVTSSAHALAVRTAGRACSTRAAALTAHARARAPCAGRPAVLLCRPRARAPLPRALAARPAGARGARAAASRARAGGRVPRQSGRF